jgi:hypothetical protein
VEAKELKISLEQHLVLQEQKYLSVEVIKKLLKKINKVMKQLIKDTVE